MSLLLLVIGTGLAQDGLDGHHFQPTPGYGRPLDLVETWQIEAQQPRSFGVQGIIDASGGALVAVHEDWNGTVETPLLDDVYALNLGLRAGLARRLALTASAPLYLASTGVDGPQGAGIGDLRLAAPLGLILPEGGGLSLGLVPALDLPTGDSEALLGAAGLGERLVAAAGWRASRATVDLNLGFGHVADYSLANQSGGSRLLGGLGAGYALGEHVGVRGEVNYERALGENIVPGTDDPGEALLSLRGHHGRGLSWTVGGGAGLTEGASAPAWRAFGGVGWAYIDDPQRDTDLDGLVDRDDGCPRDPEIKNGWKDEDGCPDQLAELVLTVRNDEGTPLAGASVVLGDQTLMTEPDGTLKLHERMPDAALGLRVTAPGYVEGALSLDRLDEGSNTKTMVLGWLPGTIRVTAKDQAGHPVAASVALTGPAAHDPLELGPEGRAQLVLQPGTWQLLATAKDLGAEGRSVTLEDRPGLTKVEFTLNPPMVEVKKTEVVITQAVLFDFNEATLRPDSDPILRQVAGVLMSHPEILRVEIQGHTDDVGDASYNLDLSQRRVEAVRTWLVAQGVAADRLTAKGYGETQPIRSNSTEAGRATNRRVQFMILEQK